MGKGANDDDPTIPLSQNHGDDRGGNASRMHFRGDGDGRPEASGPTEDATDQTEEAVDGDPKTGDWSKADGAT